MRRALLIFLSLVLALVAWTPVCAEDNFFIVPSMKGNFAPVPKTGQMQPYVAGDDGDLHKGVASPTPRFTDNQNGTVTDNLTGLIWMKNANAFVEKKNWVDALSAAATVAHGFGGLTDGSQPGDWRLPNLREFQSLVDYGRINPALPANYPFTELQMYFYWTSTTHAGNNTWAYDVLIGYDGKAQGFDKTFADNYVWCVRGGR
jgi:hypothetical protein